MADKIQLLKSKVKEQIRVKESELEDLRTKFQIIEELESESESINGAVVADGKYKDKGLTDAILDAVAILGATNGVSASKVSDYLLENGFRPKGKNHGTSVGITLHRLSDKNKDSWRLESKKVGSNRLYMPKK